MFSWGKSTAYMERARRMKLQKNTQNIWRNAQKLSIIPKRRDVVFQHTTLKYMFRSDFSASVLLIGVLPYYNKSWQEAPFFLQT